MKYELTFEEMIHDIFKTNGWYQGENFGDGYFLKIVDGVIQIWYFDDKAYGEQYLCAFYVGKGTITQKYRKVYCQPDIMRKVK